jgi:uncharacterized protein (DUF111 family)
LYLDIFSGISGDMFLGAMINLGISADEIAIAKLNIGDVKITTKTIDISGIRAVKVDVVEPNTNRESDIPIIHNPQP